MQMAYVALYLCFLQRLQRGCLQAVHLRLYPVCRLLHVCEGAFLDHLEVWESLVAKNQKRQENRQQEKTAQRLDGQRVFLLLSTAHATSHTILTGNVAFFFSQTPSLPDICSIIFLSSFLSHLFPLSSLSCLSFIFFHLHA